MQRFFKKILCWPLKISHVLINHEGWSDPVESYWPGDELIVDPLISLVWSYFFYFPLSLCGAALGWAGSFTAVRWYFEKKDFGYLIFGLPFFLILALILSSFVIRYSVFLYNVIILSLRGKKVAGIVHSWKRVRKGTPASPVYRYELIVRQLVVSDAGEKRYFTLSGKGYSKFAHDLCEGDTLTMLCDPENPTRTRIFSR